MSNGHLISTPIVDKNGKHTTVRRKASAAPKASKLAAAKPSVAPTLDPLSLLSETPRSAGNILRVALTKKSHRLSQRMLNKMFDTLQPGTIEAIDRIIKDHNLGWHAAQGLAEHSAKMRSFANLNNTALFADVFPQNTHGIHSYILGLQANRPEGSPIVDYALESTETQKATRAVLRAAMELERPRRKDYNMNDGMWSFITSPNLEALIRSRPDNVDPIITILNAHPEMKAHTPEQIAFLEEILDQGTPLALVDGAL